MPGRAEEFEQSPWVARAGDEREMGEGLQKAGKKAVFSDVKERALTYFDRKQLRGVCVYMTSAVNPSLYETESFKNELRRRAALSIPTAAARDAEVAIAEASRTLDERKKARRELEEAEEEEKMRARELLKRKREREIEAVEKLADKAKDRFSAHLRAYIDESLMPELTTLIKNTDMNERFTATIMETARNGLAHFIKAEVQQIAQYFEQNIPDARVDVGTLATMPSPDWKPVNEETYKKIGSMLLPGATLTCLLLMGPFGWLTSVALPLFVMDRFKFGEKLMDILGTLGPTRRAREEFRQKLAEGLRDAHARICDSINRDVIDDMVARFKKLSLRETL